MATAMVGATTGYHGSCIEGVEKLQPPSRDAGTDVRRAGTGAGECWNRSPEMLEPVPKDAGIGTRRCWKPTSTSAATGGDAITGDAAMPAGDLVILVGAVASR